MRRGFRCRGADHADGKGAVNQKGLDFLPGVVDEMLARNIQPWVTLYHWDLRRRSRMPAGGRSRPRRYFRDYAGVVANALGDRVKHWMAFNERGFSRFRYHLGIHAPGRHDIGDGSSDAYVNLAQGMAVRAFEKSKNHPEAVGTRSACPVHRKPGRSRTGRRPNVASILQPVVSDTVMRGKYRAYCTARSGSVEIRAGDMT